MFSRRPEHRHNRGRVASGGGALAISYPTFVEDGTAAVITWEGNTPAVGVELFTDADVSVGTATSAPYSVTTAALTTPGSTYRFRMAVDGVTRGYVTVTVAAAPAFVANVGTGASTGAGTTLNTTLTAGISLSEWIAVYISADNAVNNGGDNSEISSVIIDPTGVAFPLTKVRERGWGGAAGSGIVSSLWVGAPTSVIANGTTVRVTFANSITAKVASIVKYSRHPGAELLITQGASAGAAAAANPAAVTAPASPGGTMILLHCVARHSDATEQLTTTSASWISIVQANSHGVGTAACGIRGEWRSTTSGSTENTAMTDPGASTGYVSVVAGVRQALT